MDQTGASDLISIEEEDIIVEKYGFHYSETDDDKIIDSLDYGRSSISYKQFCNRMDKYKQEFDKDNFNGFSTIPYYARYIYKNE